jgi:SNF2-related domain/Helicase conserved C-terminal domain/SWIM zinc finger
MVVQKDALEGLQRFLNSMGFHALDRGRHYSSRGSVLELDCVEPDRLYSASVRGERVYEVQLEFANGKWEADCSCPVGARCKHIAAAMLALLERESASDSNNGKRPVRDRKLLAALQRRRWQKVREAAIGEAAIKLPRSALKDKVVAHLGRDLKPREAAFLHAVQSSFAKGPRPFTESDLCALAGPGAGFNSFGSWNVVDLWPAFPSDDFCFWLFVAWEFRRRDWRYPQFMEGVTDFSLIEPTMKSWERQKEVERWKSWFQRFESCRPDPEPGVLQLRLAVCAEEARLQWRSEAAAPFADVKPPQARKWADLFHQGGLAVEPDSFPVWSAVCQTWSYDNWWLLRYANGTSLQTLNRLLRMPLAPGRIVTADGRPLARPAEPLRIDLRPPKDPDGDYELALVTAGGAPPPKFLCTLPGQPTLYLTEEALFAGPPADMLDADGRRTIPAPALETAGGLSALHAATVPLPEHLARRVRTAPVGVTISCELKSFFQGRQNEDIFLTVDAHAPGMNLETFTASGWRERRTNGTKKVPAAGNGIVVLYDRTAQKHFPRVLESLADLKWQEYPTGWRLRVTKKTPELFAAWLRSLPAEIDVRLDRELSTLRGEPVSGTVSLEVEEASIDWFDLKVVLDLSDATLTEQELKLLLNARGGYVRLGGKGWRRLEFNVTPEDDEQLARMGLNPRDFSAEPQRFHVLQLADEAAKKFLAPEHVEKIHRRVGELKTRVTPSLPASIRAEMRPYQTEGFHFLAYLTSNRFGGVLADDMGLGKTLQTLAWLAWLRENPGHPGSETVGPSLVVCPKSVMDTWRLEAERFYPSLRVRLWRGESGPELAAARQTADLVIVNYAQLRLLSPAIADLSWLAVILDEAQYIKNPDSQTAHAARALQGEHRLTLTGTPIENRLLDLWSILSFAMPGALGTRSLFLRRFNAKNDLLARRRVAARVRPFLLRRTKAQVAKDLPDRVEEDLFCEMDGAQETLYRAELKRARQLLLQLKTNEELNKERFHILSSLLRLRQICCHPALVDAKLRTAEATKVSALEDLLEPLMEGGHKVLVFSQFVTMLDLLRETVKKHEWPHFYLAGSTENRGELVETFQSAEGQAVFLISLKAGGFGLNLTAASYVVLFDPWWNPAVEKQAIDRTHRIGQTSKVMAYRLLIRGSIEEKMRALKSQKARLADDVLGEERFSQSLTLEDLQFLFAE